MHIGNHYNGIRQSVSKHQHKGMKNIFVGKSLSTLSMLRYVFSYYIHIEVGGRFIFTIRAVWYDCAKCKSRHLYEV